jgi:uncharacterized membrane protein YhaH (DUF805 family)
MRGQILKSDDLDGPGLILGDDGARYKYSQDQVRGGGTLLPGQQVDFISLGEDARDIYALGPAPSPSPAPEPEPVAAPARHGMVPPIEQLRSQPSAPRVPPASAFYGKPLPVPGDGLWTYFIRGLTKNYFKFSGRARRQEYWGYTLFNVLTYIVAFILDIIVSAAFLGTDSSGEPNFFLAFTGLWFFYQIVPSITVTVRRLHDRDLSGWLYLINYVPYIGWIVLLVFMLMDSRAEPNVHGPSPKYDPEIEAANTFV